MHLGLYQEPVSIGPGGYQTYGPFALYIGLFARHFERVTVFAPVDKGESYFSGFPIDQPNVTVAPLPFYTVCRFAGPFASTPVAWTP